MIKLFPLLFICSIAHAQFYGKPELIMYNTKIGCRPAASISAGYILKEKESKKRNYMVGIGVSLMSIDKVHNYVPVFAEAGYYNSFDKITPFVVAQLGYSFYDGNGYFIDIDKKLMGGVYMNLKAGAGFQIKKSYSIAPFIGISYIMLREKIDKQQTNDYYKALLNAGILFVIF